MQQMHPNQYLEPPRKPMTFQVILYIVIYKITFQRPLTRTMELEQLDAVSRERQRQKLTCWV